MLYYRWGCTGFDLEMKYQWHAEGRQASLKSRKALTGKTKKAEIVSLFGEDLDLQAAA